MKNRKTSAAVSALLIFATLLGSFSTWGQDIVGTDDIQTGGGTIFVFRQSKFKPQVKLSSRRSFLNITARRRPAIRRNRDTRKSVGAAGTTQSPRRNVSKVDSSAGLIAEANRLLKTGETDKAIATYRRAVSLDNKNIRATRGLAAAFAAKGDEVYNAGGDLKYDEAAANYENAVAADPALTKVYVPLANINYQKGDFSRADGYLSKAERATGVNSETALLHGLLDLKRNENSQAATDFLNSVKLNPKNAGGYFYLGETYDRLNRSDDAVRAYRKAVEIDPAFTDGWFDLAAMHYNKGQFNEAVAAYCEVIKLDKANADAHANIASAYRQLERYKEANSEYKLAAESIKTDPDLFSEWGYCLGKVAEWDKAIARLQTARDLSPQSTDYSNMGWAYLNAAEKDLASQNTVRAQTELTSARTELLKAIELDPKSVAAYLNLGVTYVKLGDLQNALKSFGKANNLKPKWAFGLNALGRAYQSFNKHSDAIDQFEKAIAADEKFAPAYYGLGESQFKNGKKKDALKTLEKLKTINPTLAQKLEANLR